MQVEDQMDRLFVLVSIFMYIHWYNYDNGLYIFIVLYKIIINLKIIFFAKLRLRVSKQPRHLTKPPRPTCSSPNPITLTVNGGSQTSKPKSSGSSGGFFLLKLEPPYPTNQHFKSALLRSNPALIFSNSVTFSSNPMMFRTPQLIFDNILLSSTLI